MLAKFDCVLLRETAHVLAFAAVLTLLSGCALTPSGTAGEQQKLSAAGKTYELAVEKRELPEFPDAPTWEDVLQRAFLSSGELEAAYFEWKAAVERVEIASAYPNSNMSLGYSYMFSSERMKSFDRQTFSAGFDSSVNPSFPTKVMQKGKVALHEARASGERFRAAKFDLQRRVLSAWADYCLLASRARLQREQLSLARLASEATRVRAQIGGGQRELLKSDVMLRQNESEIKDTEAELAAARAILNGMLARDPDAELAAPAMPGQRLLAVTDDVVLAAAVDQNPELAALAHEVEGRADALELARLQWIPDLSPTVMFTGSVSQAIGAAIMLPTNLAEIEGGIREAAAVHRASEAMLRQAKRDRGAALIATLIAIRNSDRQAVLFEQGVVPGAERMLANAQQAYAGGAAMYTDLIDAQRMAIEARFVVVRARAGREKQLAELEALIGTDIEALNAASMSNQPHGDRVIESENHDEH